MRNKPHTTSKHQNTTSKHETVVGSNQPPTKTASHRTGGGTARRMTRPGHAAVGEDLRQGEDAAPHGGGAQVDDLGRRTRFEEGACSAAWMRRFSFVAKWAKRVFFGHCVAFLGKRPEHASHIASFKFGMVSGNAKKLQNHGDAAHFMIRPRLINSWLRYQSPKWFMVLRRISKVRLTLIYSDPNMHDNSLRLGRQTCVPRATK